MPRPFPTSTTLRRLAVACGAVLLSTFAQAEDKAAPVKEPAYASPWAFNLTLYTWFAGMKGDFSAGPVSRSVDASFIDINSESRRFPLGFMGRLEAHYERLGLYLDGNYMDLKFKPKFERLSNGLDTELGVMDYGLTYRVLGPSSAEMPAALGKKNTNWLEVYAGGRTLWLDNSVEFEFAGPRGVLRSGTVSAGKSFTSPVVGGRFMMSFTPSWFALVDGNVGGFGVDNVSFTGAVLGALGYRTSLFDIPMSLEAGYKALRYNVDKGGLVETSATLNGPFVGLTGFW